MYSLMEEKMKVKDIREIERKIKLAIKEGRLTAESEIRILVMCPQDNACIYDCGIYSPDEDIKIKDGNLYITNGAHWHCSDEMEDL